MSSSKDFELPSPNEKLPFKFILDSVKGKKRAMEPEKPEETKRDTLCGTSPRVSANDSIVQIEEAPNESSAIHDNRPIPEGKNYFRIREVSEIVGVEPYILRYWESEFGKLRPTKSASGHRVYTRKDVELLLTIRHLLYEERFSIKGAKKKLSENKMAETQKETEKLTTPALKEISSELRSLIQLVRSW